MNKIGLPDPTAELVVGRATRAERRRQSKQKTTIYHLTADQITAIKRQAADDAMAKKEYKERRKESYKKYYENKNQKQNRKTYANHELSAIAAMARDRNMSYGQFVARMEMGRPVR